MTDRSAKAEWRGDVRTGAGKVTVGDGVFEGAYSYESRFGEESGTNPEQLIAAAHAACFTMAVTNVLGEAGHEVIAVHTSAVVHLRIVDGAPTIARIDLETTGSVAGIDEAEFVRLAEAAKRVCPVSRALSGVPEIRLAAHLDSR